MDARELNEKSNQFFDTLDDSLRALVWWDREDDEELSKEDVQYLISRDKIKVSDITHYVNDFLEHAFKGNNENNI